MDTISSIFGAAIFGVAAKYIIIPLIIILFAGLLLWAFTRNKSGNSDPRV